MTPSRGAAQLASALDAFSGAATSGPPRAQESPGLAAAIGGGTPSTERADAAGTETSKRSLGSVGEARSAVLQPAPARDDLGGSGGSAPRAPTEKAPQGGGSSEGGTRARMAMPEAVSAPRDADSDSGAEAPVGKCTAASRASCARVEASACSEDGAQPTSRVAGKTPQGYIDSEGKRARGYTYSEAVSTPRLGKSREAEVRAGIGHTNTRASCKRVEASVCSEESAAQPALRAQPGKAPQGRTSGDSGAEAPVGACTTIAAQASCTRIERASAGGGHGRADSLGAANPATRRTGRELREKARQGRDGCGEEAKPPQNFREAWDRAKRRDESHECRESRMRADSDPGEERRGQLASASAADDCTSRQRLTNHDRHTGARGSGWESSEYEEELARPPGRPRQAPHSTARPRETAEQRKRRRGGDMVWRDEDSERVEYPGAISRRGDEREGTRQQRGSDSQLNPRRRRSRSPAHIAHRDQATEQGHRERGRKGSSAELRQSRRGTPSPEPAWTGRRVGKRYHPDEQSGSAGSDGGEWMSREWPRRSRYSVRAARDTYDDWSESECTQDRAERVHRSAASRGSTGGRVQDRDASRWKTGRRERSPEKVERERSVSLDSGRRGQQRRMLREDRPPTPCMTLAPAVSPMLQPAAPTSPVVLPATTPTMARRTYTGQPLRLPQTWTGRNYPFREFRLGVEMQCQLLNVPADEQVLALGQVVTEAAQSTYLTYLAARRDRREGYGTLEAAMEELRVAFTSPMEGLQGRRNLASVKLSDRELTQGAVQAFFVSFADRAANITPPMADMDLLKTFLDVLPDKLRVAVEEHFPATLHAAYEEAQRVVYLLEVSKGSRASLPAPGGPTCAYCHKQGHVLADCRSRLRSEERKNPAVPPSASGVPAPTTSRLSCFNCGKLGHKRADCKAPRAAGGREKRQDHGATATVAVIATTEAPADAQPTALLDHGVPDESGAEVGEAPRMDGAESAALAEEREETPAERMADGESANPMPSLTCWIGGSPLRALVDTGAQVSILCPEVARRLQLQPTVASPLTLRGIGHTPVVSTAKVAVELRVGGHMLEVQFRVAEMASEHEALLGMDVLRAHGAIVNLRDDYLIVEAEKERQPPLGRKRSTNVLIPLPRPRRTAEAGIFAALPPPDSDQEGAEEALGWLGRGRRIASGQDLQDVTWDDAQALPAMVQADMSPGQRFMADSEDIDFEEQDQMPPPLNPDKLTELENRFPLVADLLREFSDVVGFDLDRLREPARLNPVVVRLKDPGMQPIRLAYFRRPPAERTFLQEEVQRLLQAGIVKRSTSPWSAPCVVVPKPNGGQRLVVDYRRLNEAIVQDGAPVPRVDAVIDAVARGERVTIFTKIDLQRGYWQAPLAADSTHLTAFSTPDGHFEYLRLPMGLQLAPAAFNRELSIVFQSLPWIVQYFDDLYFASTTLEDHRSKLRQVFELLRARNLVISGDKCRFAVSSVPMLGFMLDEQGLRPDPDKVTALRQHADTPPRNVKELQRFLGSVNYYGRLIRDCARIAAPLYALCRKETHYIWSAECSASYQQLIDILVSAPVLQLPDFSRPFTLFTDASGVAVGAVLSQHSDDGQEHPVAFASRLLSKYEVHYGITELECLAVVWAVKTFRVYLLGAKFTVVTDHAALQWLLSMTDPVGRLARWGLYLQSYNFKIVYRKGAQHGNVDLLSRPLIDHVGPDPRPRGAEMSHTDDNGGNQVSATVAMVTLRPRDRQGRAASMQQAGTTEHHATSPPDETRLSRARVTALAQNEDVIPAGVNDDLVEHEDRRRAKHDITEDPALMHFMKNGRYRQGESRKQIRRVEELSRSYVWQDGALHRRCAGGLRVVPPVEDRWLLTQQAHRTGHFGAESTYNRLKERYYWSGMLADATAVAHTCAVCLRASTNATVYHPPARSIVSTGVWDAVSMDTQWGLPESSRGYKGLLVLIDHLSKFPVVFPLITKEGAEVARRLWEFIALFGPPKTLLSDNGTEFVNAVVAELSALHGVDRLVTAPYHPNTNGLVERLNHTLADALRKHADDDPLEWDRHLDHVLYAYRTRVHSTTRMTPYSLVFGRAANGLVSYQSATAIPEPVLADRLTELTQLPHQVARAISREQHVQQGQRRRTDEAHNVQIDPLAPGTVVYVRVGFKVQPKLAPRYAGPYVVERMDRAGNYCLRSTDGTLLQRAVPLPRLRVVDTSNAPDSDLTVVDAPSSTDLYDVEAILQHRTRRGVLEYLVKWARYSEAEATWEPDSQFVDMTPVERYWAALTRPAVVDT